MNSILSFLKGNMNTVINVSGAVVLILIIVNYVNLAKQKGKIDDALNRTSKKGTINRKTMVMSEHEEREDVTPETVRSLEKDFRKVCSWYHTLAQFIPLFPLAGILGTVSGLILQVSASDIEGMLASIDVALETTFWGLVWAIGLKIIVALSSARIIYDAENILDDYDKKFSNLIAQRNISEDRGEAHEERA